MAGPYERTLRVIGRYVDDQKPKDIFFFEQGGAYVLRLLMTSRQGSRHVLAEFTQEDLQSMVGPGAGLPRRAERGRRQHLTDASASTTVVAALSVSAPCSYGRHMGRTWTATGSLRDCQVTPIARSRRS